MMKKILLSVTIILMMASVTMAGGWYMMTVSSVSDATLDLIQSHNWDGFVANTVDWQDLEPTQGNYDFSAIDDLVNRASARGLKLHIRIQPQSYNRPTQYPAWISLPLPYYMLTNSAYGDCGAKMLSGTNIVNAYGVYQRDIDQNGYPDNSFFMEWNANVKARFKALVDALAAKYASSTVITGWNLWETSVTVPGDSKAWPTNGNDPTT